MEYQVIQIDEQTWRIEDGMVRFFLLTGKERALLIDSGMFVKNAKEIAESLTSLPVSLLNTHADPDHIGSNEEFPTVYMNPAECVNYRNTLGRYGDITPVWDGDILDLGGRTLEVITLPGHTPGSIAVLDTASRVLYGGDPIQDAEIFLFGQMRNIPAYLHSLRKLSRYENRFDFVYPSHGTFPLPAGIVQELIDGTERMLRNEIVPEDALIHDITVKAYHIGAAVLLCDADFVPVG